MGHETRNTKHEYRQGFTLIEIIVAVSIFIIITLATVDMMIVVIRIQENITRSQAIQDNARFSMELITKEMRTGINYQTGSICATDGSEIHFDSTSGKRVYYVDPDGSGKIYRAVGINVVNAAQCGTGIGKAFNEFTSDQVFIERLKFTLRGEKPPDASPSDGQAMAIITMKVSPDLNLQTTIVQRIRDVQ